MTQRDLVFVSYAHEDEKWRDRLRVFLTPYEKQGKFKIWADSHIPVGSRWRREIDAALAGTRVGVVLVTQDLVASDFIVDVELPALLAAVESADVVIVVVPVSAATHELLGLGEYQWARSPSKPLDRLDKPRRNEALVRITKVIVAAAGDDEERGRGHVA